MDQSLIKKIVKQYVHTNEPLVTPMVHGANNFTYKIESDKGLLILRVYGNHDFIEKLQYEHEVLHYLVKQDISFQVPAPIRLLNQETYAECDGKMIAVFPIIEGEEPTRSTIHYFELGEKVSELTVALQQCQPTAQPSYTPTFQLFDVHPNVNEDTFAEFLQRSPDSIHNSFFKKELSKIIEEIQTFTHDLPLQIIHGDLMLSNLLMKDGCIHGILDFEFVSPDFRMSEVAITMSQFIRDDEEPERTLSNLGEFIRGYRKKMTPTKNEIDALPMLIKVRMATLVFHFLGSHLAEKADFKVVESQLERFYFVISWVDKYKDRLVEFFDEH